MTEVSIPQWSDEVVAESFRSEIQARFESLNAAFRARETAELEAVLREHPERRGQPGFEIRDSVAWSVYQASEIRVDQNSVMVVLPRGLEISIDLVHLFDHTTVAWSRPSIGAVIVDGEARPTIEVLLVATWDAFLDAAWHSSGQGRKQVLVELFEEDARSLVEACDCLHRVACNCADLPLKIRDRVLLALEALP